MCLPLTRILSDPQTRTNISPSKLIVRGSRVSLPVCHRWNDDPLEEMKRADRVQKYTISDDIIAIDYLHILYIIAILAEPLKQKGDENQQKRLELLNE